MYLYVNLSISVCLFIYLLKFIKGMDVFSLFFCATAYVFILSYCVASSCSDNEEDKVSRNGRPAKSEFKDDEETVTTKSVQITQTADTSTTRKRGGVPSKTVDLGAAAHYTGDKSSPDHDITKVQYISFGEPEVTFFNSCNFRRCG